MKSFDEFTRRSRGKAQDMAGRATDSARQTAEAARTRIQDSYGKAKSATGDLAARGKEQADSLARVSTDAYEKGKIKARKANSKLRNVAEEQPMTLLAGAAAFGALIGSLLPGRKD